jgi:hypothetical protein
MLYRKQWKYIPVLGTTFLIYSVVGVLSGHNFLWFFTENPYNLESPYGKGGWTFFIKRYDWIMGLPGLILLLAGTFILFRKIFSGDKTANEINRHMKIFLLVFCPAAIISFFHIYAWAEGKFGSGGIERVFASVLPYVAIIIMYVVDWLLRMYNRTWYHAVVTVVILFFMMKAITVHYKYPLKSWGGDKIEIEASKWFVKEREPNSIIYYAHPALIFFCDYNPFDKKNLECFSFPTDCTFDKTKTIYYFWDSMFSEFSCKTKIETLENCAGMKRIKEFKEKEENGFRLIVFKYTPEK